MKYYFIVTGSPSNSGPMRARIIDIVSRAGPEELQWALGYTFTLITVLPTKLCPHENLTWIYANELKKYDWGT